MNPIGYFRSSAQYKAQAPRQGIFEESRIGTVTLASGMNFEIALRDLEGFERIWLVYHFDRNQDWRPTTRPPVPAPHSDRVGVFASRSPYRPNPIGLSCVKLLSVKGLELTVEEADLLDNTPILDIKPYIPAYDSFPDAKAGWLDDQKRECFEIFWTETFTLQSNWIFDQTGLDLLAFAKVQLSLNPMDSTRKRVSGESECAILSHRTWRIHFSLSETDRKISLNSISSGYTEKDLLEAADPYSDKTIHIAFRKKWA